MAGTDSHLREMIVSFTTLMWRITRRRASQASGPGRYDRSPGCCSRTLEPAEAVNSAARAPRSKPRFDVPMTVSEIAATLAVGTPALLRRVQAGRSAANALEA